MMDHERLAACVVVLRRGQRVSLLLVRARVRAHGLCAPSTPVRASTPRFMIGDVGLPASLLDLASPPPPPQHTLRCLPCVPRPFGAQCRPVRGCMPDWRLLPHAAHQNCSALLRYAYLLTYSLLCWKPLLIDLIYHAFDAGPVTVSLVPTRFSMRALLVIRALLARVGLQGHCRLGNSPRFVTPCTRLTSSL